MFRYFLLAVLFGFLLLVPTQLYLSKRQPVVSASVRGIILPHHDLAREYIFTSLDRLAKTHQYRTIIIIGPNHYQPESTLFLSTTSYFDYPLNTGVISDLVSKKLIYLDTTTAQNDHSLGNPISYLHQYFPTATFVPILSPAKFDPGKIKALANIISKNLPSDTLIVASVDFSHGRSVIEAIENNRQSEESIKNFEYSKIYQFRDDHLDSPPSIGLLLNIMQDIGSTNWNTWVSSHGSFIDDKFGELATSYLIGTFGN